VTELATSADFVVRPAEDGDLGYVRKTWLQEHAQSSGWIDAVGGGAVYFREHQRARDAAIERGAVVVACRPSVRSGICGFAVTGPGDLVHFVYVKPRWRRLGVARLLLAPLLEREGVTATHETTMSRARDRGTSLVPWPAGWTFNPYPFLRTA